MSRIGAEHSEAIAITVAVVLVVVVFGADTPVRRAVLDLIAWMNAIGPAAIALFVVVFVAGSLLLVPRTLFTLAAGFLYGAVPGAAISFGSALVGALLAFAIGRRAGRTWVMRKLATHRRVAALDRTVDRAGVKITIFARMTPFIPFGILNYALALTRMSLRDYAVATAVGIVPGSILNAYIGSQVTVASRLGAAPSLGEATTWIGIAVAIVSLAAISWVAHRELAHALHELHDETR